MDVNYLRHVIGGFRGRNGPDKMKRLDVLLVIANNERRQMKKKKAEEFMWNWKPIV